MAWQDRFSLHDREAPVDREVWTTGVHVPTLDRPLEPDQHRCARCGQVRQARANPFPLCRDCKGSMPKAQQEAWL